MAFNREVWTDWSIRKPCPNCIEGKLIPIGNRYLLDETPNSIEMNSLGGYYSKEYIFSIHLKCSSGNCEQYVAVSGDRIVYDTKKEDTDEIETITSYNPKSFYPAPNIIKIPQECSELFTQTLKESFSLYWLDLSSCANKIRLSIEVLMSDFNISKSHSLHKRIEIFGKEYETVSKYLLSVKYIGNEGSHNPKVERDDILSAYQLLDYTLEILYVDNSEKEKKISAISEEVSNRLDPKKNSKIL